MHNKGHFLFYGNSQAHIGAGHIMRLFALAQAAHRAGFKVSFLYKHCLPSHRQMLLQEGFSCTHCCGLLSEQAIAAIAPTHLVIDDYYLSSKEWQMIKNVSAFKILFDDALHMEPLYADLIVNASPDASVEAYKKRNQHALLCLGPQYTLLRKEFRAASLTLPLLQERTQVLVLMGGTDIKHLTLALCHSMLEQYPNLSLSAIIGECAPQYEEALRHLAQQYPNTLKLYVKTDQVASIMAQSGLAISSAGGSLSELACMHVPTLALVCADNQLNALHSEKNNTWYKALDFRHYGQNAAEDKLMLHQLCILAYGLYQDLAQRTQMQQQIAGAIDGLGCQRIIQRSICYN